MRPSCGEVLLTMDRLIWERSRMVIRLSFYKSNISELDAFESSVEQLIVRILQNGSIIELQRLILLMIRATSYT